MRIARLGDKFKIKLGEVEVIVSPLSGRQKLEMTSMVKQGPDKLLYIDKVSQEFYLVKHSVKEINGLQDFSCGDYKLSFEGECLTDDCAEEVLGFLLNTYFTTAYTQTLNGKMGQVINPYNEKVIEGVTVEKFVKQDGEEGKK